MRQKYIISKDVAKNKLKIKEYAIIDKDVKKASPSLLRMEHFSLLCEEAYDGADIERSFSNGVDGLIVALRTDNLFPIGPHATQIAESVMELYKSTEDGSVELFFDDVDLFEKNSLMESELSGDL